MCAHSEVNASLIILYTLIPSSPHATVGELSAAENPSPVGRFERRNTKLYESSARVRQYVDRDGFPRGSAKNPTPSRRSAKLFHIFC